MFLHKILLMIWISKQTCCRGLVFGHCLDASKEEKKEKFSAKKLWAEEGLHGPISFSQGKKFWSSSEKK